ncbi:energy-coupling factor transporter transmembrane protein EcfT [Paenibacillus sp. J2TS4]|uniref:energy-coupling factor transporter transmembrane component T family protein n=1 Tax=Paenibacillus sp. J2TS4 TaxID=2807194 RepID=UPI001B012AB1|nr:energy-coupling factor transporter transmembrane component T [Paenibacillus sp. J2TS4]GIP34141.1 putative HMP/thiamine permease protein YkoC [Paenibacillus sp. J2TS4]
MLLQSINPSIKVAVVLVCVFLLALVFDPLTPLLFLIWTVGVTFLFGKVPVKKWLLFFSPFLIVAFGYVWTAVLFAKVPEGGVETILFRWGWLEVTREALVRGGSLALRMLSFAALSLMFVFTTDPTRLMLSLMQQCKLSPKLAYSIMAGYRFLPLFKEELQILQNAHRVRGLARRGGWREKLKQIGRYVIPLLASAIRKAERTAIAMESKGFTGARERTFYLTVTVQIRDWIFLGSMLAALMLSFYISWKLGLLQWYAGQL